MRVIPNNFDIPPRLYQYICANEDGNEFEYVDYKTKFSGISIRHNQVLTWATSPNAKEMAQMSESTRAKEVWICAAYAPAGNSNFQLDRIDEGRYREERFENTPWMKEINGEMDPDEFGYDFVIPKRNFRRLKDVVVEHAVCIATDVRNPVHNEKRPQKGSKRTCHVFFNRIHGIYRLHTKIHRIECD
ncbi:unnamed protein product [Caenorhabditis brenneri]